MSKREGRLEVPSKTLNQIQILCLLPFFTQTYVYAKLEKKLFTVSKQNRHTDNVLICLALEGLRMPLE